MPKETKEVKNDKPKETKEVKSDKPQETKEVKSDNTKETTEVIAAKIYTRGNIISAFIGAITVLITAFFAFPPFQEFVKSLGQTGESQPLAMEAIPRDVFVFAGNDNPDGGRGTFSLIYHDEDIPNYRMEYSLPEDKYGYAGMVFRFPGGYNLSAYKTIEFTIMFKTPNDEIELFVKDIGGKNDSIRIVNNGKNEMNLSYGFANFTNINFNAVMEIGVFASTNFSTGSHDVWVKNIHFVK